LNKKHITLVGPIPPPLGGVSVHVSRLAYALCDEGYIIHVYSDSNKTNKFDDKISIYPLENPEFWGIKQLFSCKNKIIHYHGHSWNLRFILTLSRIKRKKIILSFHSLRDNWQNFKWTKKLKIMILLKLANYIIVVNPKHRDRIIKWGCHPEKVKVIDAFLPPTKIEVQYNYSAGVKNFIRSGKPIIIANGWKLKFYNGDDLYGADLMIKLSNDLRAYFPKVKVLFYLGEIGNSQYYNKMIKKIKDNGLTEYFKFIIGERLITILNKANLFIRPTNTDSFGVSIKEALYYNVPALASDVCKRPEGTIIFKNRDYNDLLEKTINILENQFKYTNMSKASEIDSNFKKILELYRI